MTDPEPERKRRGRPPSGGREAILEATLALLRERGIANLTSRDVAARAGVSDASVYYHFRDRPGLIEAAFEHGMKPLMQLTDPDAGASSPADALRGAMASLELFFDEVLPVFFAAQADEELRSILSNYIAKNDLGPHKGVERLGAYLRREQAAGNVRAEADADAIALLIIDCAFSRAAQRMMMSGEEERLPSGEALLHQVSLLL